MSAAADPTAYPNEEHVKFTPREFTEFAVRLKGKPISLDRRPWTHRIYDTPVIHHAEEEYRRKILLIFGRQCEKSTTIANFDMALANLFDHMRLLYVTASNEQMREFSEDKLRAIILDSPHLKRLAGMVRGRENKETQNVQTKRWINQSRLVLRSVYRSPDRVRGISADVLNVDELQDVYTDYLPVIEEVLFASELEGGPISVYAGTPKTYDNPLEQYWSRHSTRNEWVVKCQACNKWNVIEIKHIGPRFLRCEKCSKEIDPIHHGRWVRMGRATAEWEGFRVPQPIVMYTSRHNRRAFERRWRDLIKKKNRYNRAKFQNEVMARSYDAGTKPVTFDEVRRCCLSDVQFIRPEEVGRRLQATHSWAGVDWGTGDESYTILSIWAYDPGGRFRCWYSKRYEGIESDPDFLIADIIKTCRRFRVNRIGADWGFGFGLNPKLQKAFGATKVLLYYHAGKQKKKVDWDKYGHKFITHRTRVLQDIFTLIKRGPVSGGICFPNFDAVNTSDQTTESFVNDILSVYSEFSESSREMRFDHPKGVPDDFLHTAVYALLASQFDRTRPDLNSPGSGYDFKN